MNDFPPQQGLYDPRFEKDACGIGFVVNVKGVKSHSIIEQGIQVLTNLHHRGACGCDPDTGDGGGILLQIPHAFLQQEARTLGFELPELGRYGAGLVFLPQDAAERTQCIQVFEQAVRDEGQTVLGWRDVPVHSEATGWLARRGEPVMRQFFVAAAPDFVFTDANAFERKLYVIRRLAERGVKALGLTQQNLFYIPSFSSRVMVYKGQLMPHQMTPYFPDLDNPLVTSALALVHQRYSTNTFPSWPLSQPFRYIAHNGEINTLRGNINWMRANEGTMSSELFGEDLQKLYPILQEEGSDSAIFDNALELLVMAGRSLPHAILMLIPEAWSKNDAMDEEKRAFYEFHASMMEPWDGPASIAFTDGRVIGAILDRNGLRPSRYVVTKDDFVVMASEVGVLPIPEEDIISKGRLQPGKMFLIDTEQGRIIADEEIKDSLKRRQPYGQWLKENMVRFASLPRPAEVPDLLSGRELIDQQIAFGYSEEDLRMVVAPMGHGEEAVGSMGTDTPLAVLSDKPQLLFNYFKQLFAQVTNPPIDSIREEIVMSMETTLGPDGNLLDETPEHCHQLKILHPIITNRELEKIKRIDHGSLRTKTLSMLWPASEGPAGLQPALERLCSESAQAIADGYTILVLSDRGVSSSMVAIPSLLATAAVHHHLVRTKVRGRCGLVIETAEAREMMHFALLIGYGAGAINPYLALDSLLDLVREGVHLKELDTYKAIDRYIKSTQKGLLKIIAKMGISTIQSYRGAQIFEAVGLSSAVIDAYFTGTVSRIGGIGLDVIAQEALIRHQAAFPVTPIDLPMLELGGQYHWRRDGERHLSSPDAVSYLQHAVMLGNYNLFKKYTRVVDDQPDGPITLRSCLDFDWSRAQSISIDEVEPASEIVKRFCTGAMSYGSISREAHETLAIAMNRLGGKSNTGEGGEDEARFVPDANGDLRRSKIKQIASGRFGVTSNYLANADELQIKMAQGAKPGEGGQLPGHKVSTEIARVRHSVPGVTLISPPPHHDIYSIEDLAQLIFDLKNSNPRANVSVKLVAEAGVGTIAAGVSKGHAEGVLISGHDGGTGASPLTSIKHSGLPWELGLAETQQVLVLNDLRGRIRVQTDGQLKSGRDVAIAALLGADEFGFSTTALMSMGCIMMRKCHLNTCPVGVATQDEELRKQFRGRPEYVVNFFMFIAEELRELMAKLGFRTIEEMIGRSDLLVQRQDIKHWKAKHLDFSRILYRPTVEPSVATHNVTGQDHGIDDVLDRELIKRAQPALERQEPVSIALPVRNVNRTVGTMLSYEISTRYGSAGLPDGSINIQLKGSSGQSLGAWLTRGVSITVEGESNDYVGKGLSGGTIVVYPSSDSSYIPEQNIIVGNVALYGATSGQAFFRGMAGERFCVRNSGATAVVEGVGDHGCEYMTGGCVVVLGPTGRNFAAGMSGGFAFIYNEDGQFEKRCNMGLVALEPVSEASDIATLRSLIERHAELTNSAVAARMLANWEEYLPRFVKVFPHEYRRALREAAERKANEMANVIGTITEHLPSGGDAVASNMREVVTNG